MNAIDTNVLVRLLTEDDPIQTGLARRLFESEQVFIPDTVILETVWVLSYSYGLPGKTITAGLRRLFGLTNVSLRDPAMTRLALDWCDAGLGFADALHVAQSAQCTRFVTFDRQLINKAAGLTTPAVESPQG